MNTLTAAQRRELRAKAHGLDPVVSIAEKGLAPTVLKEIDRSLTAHELIKIRVYGDDREARQQYMETICNELGCAAVQMIGKLLVVYRPSPELAEKAKSTTKAPAISPRVTPRTAGRGDARSDARGPARPATRLKSGTIARNIAGPRGAAAPRSGGRKPGGGR
ncbi:ribosome assembly RNA-binding protein YhbY [Niveibacterium sp.]|uniref:ribosome assembly RNA-binding protein YhbY n=1 Tax=Niveibacterium sp. TaxID=2017444 RepID=UPI0035ADA7A2